MDGRRLPGGFEKPEARVFRSRDKRRIGRRPAVEPDFRGN